MALFFAFAENLSSLLLNRGSVFHVLIPGVRWFYQTKSQGIVVFDYLYIFKQFSHLRLKFYPLYFILLKNSCN